MKRLLSILLIISLCAVFTACAGKTESSETEATTSQAVTKAPKATSAAIQKAERLIRKGVDVSSYSGDIDWKEVKKSGIDFAMIRLGGRGYGAEGGLYTDKTALDNIDNAKAAGIKVGGYFFSQALTENEAREEAEYIIKLLDGRKLSLPIAYDLEKLADEETRIENLSYAQGLKNASVFRKVLEKNGHKTAVYIESDGFLGAEDFNESEVWYSDFGKPYENDYLMLQYSKEGKVGGIPGDVDLNIMYIN